VGYYTAIPDPFDKHNRGDPLVKDPCPKEPEKQPENDEARLFRDSIGAVRPVKADEKVRHQSRPPPTPAQTDANEARVRDELLTHQIDPGSMETGEELGWCHSSVSPTVFKRLRRGQFSVGAVLDLHHMNQEAARRSIHQFLDDCHRERVSCARIIHGKGLRSRFGGPVLKALTDSLLRRHPDVLAFASARPEDGGTGAAYVLLKKR
jgi:DNA-nicking Smr family endonuclease